MNKWIGIGVAALVVIVGLLLFTGGADEEMSESTEPAAAETTEGTTETETSN